jgi:NADH dehydrogenase FAD-containing subunit
MQEARYVATVIARRMPPEERATFQYADRGILATIGRAQAVAEFGSLDLSGVWAWFLWCFVRIFFLIGFRNRSAWPRLKPFFQLTETQYRSTGLADISAYAELTAG